MNHPTGIMGPMPPSITGPMPPSISVDKTNPTGYIGLEANNFTGNGNGIGSTPEEIRREENRLKIRKLRKVLGPI